MAKQPAPVWRYLVVVVLLIIVAVFIGVRSFGSTPTGNVSETVKPGAFPSTDP
jgi:hypothetical protein